MNNRRVQVFISYRRETGRDIARNIYERLTLSGYSTFFDYDSTRQGKFNEQIFTAIEQCKDFVLVLSPNALKRCNDAGDWVRIEIERAIKHKKNIILIATEEFDGFPSIPESISEIKYINIIFLVQKYYNESFRELCKALTSKPSPSTTYIALILFTIIVIFGAIILWHGKAKHTTDIVNKANSCSAMLYLMRYDDFNRENNGCLTDHYRSYFEYDDSIGTNSNMYIYPKSKYLSYSSDYGIEATDGDISRIPYHNPIIRLKLHNKGHKTIVFDKAILEIDDFHYDERPIIRINVNNDALLIVNEGNNILKKAMLMYSGLHSGESFTHFSSKKEIILNDTTSVIPLNLNNVQRDSIIGQISFQNGVKIPFSFGSHSTTHEPDLLQFTNYSLKVETYSINGNSEQTIPMKLFCRSLVKGEIDDEVYFILNASHNCTFRIRMKLATVSGEQLYSNYLYIRNSTPNNGINIFKIK